VHPPQACVAPLQLLWPCRVSSASKFLGVATWAVRLPHLVVNLAWEAAPPPSSLRHQFCGSTEKPSGFVVNHSKPRGLGVAFRQSPLMTWPPQLSRVDLGFKAQPRNRPRLRLAVLSTMWSALDPVNHRVPRTKPTCMLHTYRPTGIDLSCLFLTCTDSNQAATCTCNT
jgi:hypothetical protein